METILNVVLLFTMCETTMTITEYKPVLCRPLLKEDLQCYFQEVHLPQIAVLEGRGPCRTLLHPVQVAVVVSTVVVSAVVVAIEAFIVISTIVYNPYISTPNHTLFIIFKVLHILSHIYPYSNCSR